MRFAQTAGHRAPRGPSVLVVIACAAIVLTGFVRPAHAGATLEVLETTPAANAVGTTVGGPGGGPVEVLFDRPLDPATIGPASVRVFGRWSGVRASAPGAIALDEDGRRLRITIDPPVSAGELVTVMLSGAVRGLDRSAIQAGGYAFQFWTASRPAGPLELAVVQDLTTRTRPGVTTRSYGGVASDLDEDGWLDLAIVNEDSADVRVFRNRGDGTPAVLPFDEPTYAVGDRASPSETADFDGDGHMDLCVVNINPDTVSVLLGRGDGGYHPQQVIAVGSTPRGIAVLDVEGDGDADIVNTNSGSGNLSLLLNDGTGTFGPPSFFQGGVSGEWSLAAADVDLDGRLDLIVGGLSGQQINVLRSNGDGTFTAGTPSSAGGRTWMIAVGDLDGDGLVDVTSANSALNNGSVLLNDGAGGFGPPSTYAVDPFPLATDVGDLDGDGDLDWVLSSFQGDFRVLLNDGTGVFVSWGELDAPTAASCALCVDIDNDRDLDLALVDELADRLILVENLAEPDPGDLDGDGAVGTTDLLLLLAAWGTCPPGAPCVADLDGDAEVSTSDLLLLLAAWSG